MAEQVGRGVRALDSERHEQVAVALPAEPRAGEHVSRAGIPEGLIEAPEELEQRVTPLELFFDLVFVFAITQVTGYVSARPFWTRLIEGLAILAVALVRLVRVRMAGKHRPHRRWARSGDPARRDGGDADRVARGAARLRPLRPDLRRRLLRRARTPRRLLRGRGASAQRPRVTHRRLAPRVYDAPAAALLVVAGASSGIPRALCWVAALTVDYGGSCSGGCRDGGSRPGHFAERHRR